MVPGVARDHIPSDHYEVRLLPVEDVPHHLLGIVVLIIGLSKVDISELHHFEGAFRVEVKLLVLCPRVDRRNQEEGRS